MGEDGAARLDGPPLSLRDGRRLGYARLGAPGGAPVYYFHGGNGSRIEAQWFEHAARKRGVELIAPDRPGFGLSDLQPRRRLLDWPADVAALADSLGHRRFAVFGLSGGGPHVVATCHALPGRVTRAAIVSGLAPPEMPHRLRGMWPPLRALFALARFAPGLQRVALRRMSAFYADRAALEAGMLRALPAPDRELISRDPRVLGVFSASAREAHRNGIDGDACEWQIYLAAWGFALGAVKTPIALWYGDADANAPPAMGRYLAASLGDARLHAVRGGHFSTIHDHIDPILAGLSDERGAA